MPTASRFGELRSRHGDIIEHSAAGGRLRGSEMNKPTRLLVVMDPIDQIKYRKDTTLALLLAAQARGYRLDYAELADLRLRDGVAEVRARRPRVRAAPHDWVRPPPP